MTKFGAVLNAEAVPECVSLVFCALFGLFFSPTFMLPPLELLRTERAAQVAKRVPRLCGPQASFVRCAASRARSVQRNSPKLHDTAAREHRRAPGLAAVGIIATNHAPRLRRPLGAAQRPVGAKHARRVRVRLQPALRHAGDSLLTSDVAPSSFHCAGATASDSISRAITRLTAPPAPAGSRRRRAGRGRRRRGCGALSPPHSLQTTTPTAARATAARRWTTKPPQDGRRRSRWSGRRRLRLRRAAEAAGRSPSPARQRRCRRACPPPPRRRPSSPRWTRRRRGWSRFTRRRRRC